MKYYIKFIRSKTDFNAPWLLFRRKKWGFVPQKMGRFCSIADACAAIKLDSQ